MNGREVSSVVCESGSADDAGYADLAGWMACLAVGNQSAGMEFMRRLDARSVASGQMSREEFVQAWNADPYEILDSEANRPAARSTVGGEEGVEGAPPGFRTE